MRRALLALLLLSACGTGHAARARLSAPSTADELFANRSVPRLDLVVAQDGLDELARQGKSKQKGAWVHATVVWGAERFDDVAVRLKGNRSRRALDDKPAFKLDFEKFDRGRTFLGLGAVALNNLVEDPTMMHETLAYEVFRAVGVPAPRTAYVDVRLNGEPYGLYLLVETIDKDWGGGTKSAYEGEFGCDLVEEDVAGFDRDVGDDDKGRDDLRELARAAGGSLEGLLFADGAPLDGAEALTYLAVSAFLGDFDGYRHAHNYRLRRARHGRFAFVPWGLDRTFDRRLDVHDSGGLVARRCFADEACRRAYDATVRVVAARVETLGLLGRIDELAEVIDVAAGDDPRRPYSPRKILESRAELRKFLAERPAEVRAETNDASDADGDGWAGLDCDDGDGAVHPGALEICGDGVDNDCSGLVDDAPACGCRTVDADGARFELCELPMTWDEAAAFCAAKGLALARVDTAEQAKRVAALAKKLDAKDPWWIGLSTTADGLPRWRDGEVADYSKFAKGEPDASGCRSTCVVVKPKSGKWSDLNCAQRKPFVCR